MFIKIFKYRDIQLDVGFCSSGVRTDLDMEAMKVYGSSIQHKRIKYISLVTINEAGGTNPQ